MRGEGKDRGGHTQGELKPPTVGGGRWEELRKAWIENFVNEIKLMIHDKL